MGRLNRKWEKLKDKRIKVYQPHLRPHYDEHLHQQVPKCEYLYEHSTIEHIHSGQLKRLIKAI